MGAIRRHPKTVVATAVVGVLALAGVAIAAILLSTSITGQANVVSEQASDEITDVQVVGQDGLTCEVSFTAEEVTVNATASEVVGEDGSTGGDTAAGSCDIQSTISNTGDVPLFVTGTDVSLPDGWTYELLNDIGDPDSEFGPGEDETAVYRLSSTADATSGQISGTVTTSTDPS